MRITLNGSSCELADGVSVAELVAAHGLQPPRVAVEVNTRLVPRHQFGDTRLSEGDQVEIVTFVGGG
jgi:thiamine biosynthesis protein ThiS